MFDSREPIGTVEKKGYQFDSGRRSLRDEEALRRIREAEETGALELDLSQLAFESTSSGVGKPHPASRARSFLVLRDIASPGGPHLAPIDRPLQ